jgi:ketosteroid isomerase-like protein
MSDADVAVVRRLFDAFNAGDFDTATALLHDDIELHQARAIPDTDDYYGKEAFVQGIVRWLSGFERGFRYEPIELIDAPNGVFAIVRLSGRGRESGVPLERDVFQVWRTRDGQLSRCSVHWGDPEPARREAGLEP